MDRASLSKAFANAAKSNQLHVEIANSTNKEKPTWLVELTKLLVGDKSAEGVILAGRKPISSVEGLTDNQLKHARSKDRIERDDVYFIPLKKKRELVLFTSKKLDDQLIKMLSEQLNQFKLNRTKSYLVYVIGALIFSCLFLPIQESINAPGTVIGERGYQVTTSTAGVIDSISVPYGSVTNGQSIATISNNDLLSLDKTKIELRGIEEKMRARGASRSDEDITVLRLEKRKLEFEIKRLSNDINDSQITAPVSGLVEWKPNVLGSFVERGQSVASINPESQENVQVLINVSDWINIKVGDKAVFINGRDYEKYDAVVKSIPTQAESNNGATQFKINILLDGGLPTGTTGTVSVKANSTYLAAWLLRKQLAIAKAYMSL